MSNNNDFSMPDTNSKDRPSSQLDIYDEAVQSSADDEFLQNVNLGLGNYDGPEYWQQMQSYEQGLYADEAFGRRLQERAIAEAKNKMAREGWSYYDENREKVIERDGWEKLDESEKQDQDRRRYLKSQGEKIWSKLNERERYDALVELTGFSEDWMPPQWRMLMARHEGSRSKGGRLIDNIFGRVQEVKETSNLEKKRMDR